MDNLLKLLVLLLPCKKSDLSIRTLTPVHIVPQQNRTNLSVCSVHHVNYLMSQFELFIHVFGRCRYQHCGQTLFSRKVFCCIDQLIPQLHELVEICRVRFWTSRNSLLLSLLKTLSFTSK